MRSLIQINTTYRVLIYMGNGYRCLVHPASLAPARIVTAARAVYRELPVTSALLSVANPSLTLNPRRGYCPMALHPPANIRLYLHPVPSSRALPSCVPYPWVIQPSWDHMSILARQ